MHIRSPGRWGKLQIYHGDGFRNMVGHYAHSMTTNDSLFNSLLSVASSTDTQSQNSLCPCVTTKFNIFLDIVMDCKPLFYGRLS